MILSCGPSLRPLQSPAHWQNVPWGPWQVPSRPQVPPRVGLSEPSRAMAEEEQTDAGYTVLQTYPEKGALHITTRRRRFLMHTDHLKGVACPEAAPVPCRR